MDSLKYLDDEWYPIAKCRVYIAEVIGLPQSICGKTVTAALGSCRKIKVKSTHRKVLVLKSDFDRAIDVLRETIDELSK